MKIDLRSDTLTVPSSEMLKKMMSAKVGDDVWEEDPTVKTLENIISNALIRGAESNKKYAEAFELLRIIEE